MHSYSVCITTGIYSIATNPNVVATSLFCIVTSNSQFLPYCMLVVQEYDTEDNEGNITRMWYVLKVAPLESNPGFSLRPEDS